MLHLYQSNRLEDLAELLTQLHTTAPLSNPFASEQIIVQSQGMRRYISQYLAQHTGIAANLKFSLPAGFAWQLMRQAMPNIPELSPFASEVMRWRLLDLFQSNEFHTSPDFQAAKEVLQSYLNNGAYAAYQLAGQLADVFDQYLVYRPEWIEAWANNQTINSLKNDSDQTWQAQIWRYLDQTNQNIPHRVQIWHTLMDTLAQANAMPHLAKRYFVFGIATLAPMHFKLLEQLALHREVHILALNPSNQYWGNILEPTQILKLGDEADLSIQGHPLLASLGKQGRDFFNELAEAQVQLDIDTYNEEPQSHSLLHSIQHQIQTQVLPEDAHKAGWLNQHQHYLEQHIFPTKPQWKQQFQAATAQTRPIVQLNADNSLQIHSAHSPLRELQILKDQLLDLLNQHPEWQPSDIAVLTPHIEPYAPYIKAIFSEQTNGSPALPFTLSDVKLSHRQPLLDALEQTLELLNSRLEADKLLALLDNPLILAHHQINREDLPLIHDTVNKLNIKWGSDAQERAQHGDTHNLFTWQQGLDRLILGFMLPENTQNPLWQNIAPHSSHPDHIPVYSKLAALVRLLAQTKHQWQQSTTAQEWSNRIRSLTTNLLTPQTQEDHAALQQLETALTQWQNETTTANYNQALPQEIALQHIVRFLSSQDEKGFLRGGITFCSMVPMRSLPFQVICLLGLNDGDFPRNTKAAPFDLIARYPQKGDRARRDDDRYLFLEALMSARSVLYLSYIGKDIRTDEERAPSTLIGELIDTLSALSNQAPKDLKQQWLTQHPLQPFSRQYYTANPKLHSARQDYAHALNHPQPQPKPFINPTQPENPPPAQKTDQKTFLHYWRNPLRHWLNNQLNWSNPYTQSTQQTQEPFLPDQPRQLADAYTRARLQNQDYSQLAQTLAAQSQLPTGKLGELVRQEYQTRAIALPKHLISSPAQAEQSGELLGVLTYHLTHNHQDGQILYASQFLNERNAHGKLQHTDKIELLLRHLIYNAATPDNSPTNRQTHYLSLQESYSLPPIDQQTAQDTLSQWLIAYQAGQSHPLPFFPRVNLAAATALYTKEKATWETAQSAAQKAYHNGYNGFAQEDYPEVKLIYGRNTDEDPPYTSEVFQRLTENLFANLSGCLKVLADKDEDKEE
ncbi:exodeoxyribonuclease V subunit gamma [Kingella negevensis]|uniref:exodeoxyribonuclease V subunit gamma n=1 Tax=Kingella negevensis TaxID=1522312 RepID=UPI00050A2DD4|nr:exodeoxyribonuclease V subunit gamma [Kingella negevensis]MDK4688498.1 exodeoxyribonuclease V subunit gamma [Kingella negevensis]WII90249.1 exodeoxyribonuclease V subunit gamma [Kingella negevensis]